MNQLDLSLSEPSSSNIKTPKRAKGVFITGATRGIGLSLAEIYLEQNYIVGTCARQIPGEGQNEIPLNIKKYIQEDLFIFYQADVRDITSLKMAISKFAEKCDLEIVVANAGIAFQEKKVWPSFELSHQIIDVNIHGLLNTFQIGLDVFKNKGKGQLVAMSSLAGYLGLPGVSAYAASKAFVRIYCESLSLDLAHHNISVTSICPGYVKTNLTKKNGHYMPFLMSPKQAALKSYKAIKEKKINQSFPLTFYILVKLLSFFPRKLYFLIMHFSPIHFTKEKK
jgi:short-subunit dehydrogenase